MNSLIADPARPTAARVRLQSDERHGWQGFGAQLVDIAAGRHAIAATAQHRVGLHVGAPVRARCACDGRRVTRLQAHGDADVIPAGVDGVWTDEGDCTVLRVWFDDSFVHAMAQQRTRRYSPTHIQPRLQWRDPRLQHLAWALLAELEAPDTHDALFAESIGTAMVVRLLDGTAPSDAPRARLAARTASLVTDYIECHLDQRLTLGELAALAGMSVPHFKVLFRETLGVPVHQYVVRRRVERARSLLLRGQLSVSQVALDVGFAHQSHLAHWMNRVLGTTPREIMKRVK